MIKYPCLFYSHVLTYTLTYVGAWRRLHASIKLPLTGGTKRRLAIQFCCCMFCNLGRHMRSTSHFGMRHIINRGSAPSPLQETCQGYCSESTGRGGGRKNTPATHTGQWVIVTAPLGMQRWWLPVYLHNHDTLIFIALNSAAWLQFQQTSRYLAVRPGEQFVHYSFPEFAPSGSPLIKRDYQQF